MSCENLEALISTTAKSILSIKREIYTLKETKHQQERMLSFIACMLRISSNMPNNKKPKEVQHLMVVDDCDLLILWRLAANNNEWIQDLKHLEQHRIQQMVHQERRIRLAEEYLASTRSRMAVYEAALRSLRVSMITLARWSV